MLLASAARGGQGTVAQAAMIRQLLRLTQAVYEAAQAAEQARQARLLAEDVRGRLTRVRDALPAVSAEASSTTAAPAATLDSETQAMLDRLRAGQAQPATAATSPVPNKIEPTKPRQRTGPGAERGPER